VDGSAVLMGGRRGRWRACGSAGRAAAHAVRLAQWYCDTAEATEYEPMGPGPGFKLPSRAAAGGRGQRLPSDLRAVTLRRHSQ
jgi:hypothetical protein